MDFIETPLRLYSSLPRRATAGFTALTILALILPSRAAAQSRDEDVFQTQTPPNVALFVDNSNSMDNPIYHTAYEDGNVPASFFNCDPFALPGPSSTILAGFNSSGRFNGYIQDEDGKDLWVQCKKNRARRQNCKIIPTSAKSGHSDYVLSPNPLDHPDTNYIERTFCGRSRNIWNDGETEAFGDTTRYLGNYAAWLYSLDEADSTLIGPPGFQETASQILFDIDNSYNDREFISGDTFGKYQRTRMTAARNIISDVIYRTNTDCPAYTPSCTLSDDRIRFGLGIFDPEDHGGFMKVPVDVYSNNRSDLENSIRSIQSDTLTPLGESLFKIYTYFMSRTNSNIPLGADGTTAFPKYRYSATDGAFVTNANTPPSPVIAECQKNFVIMVTDGAPWDDNFDDKGSTRARGFDDFDDLVGDYYPDAPGDADAPDEPGGGTWGNHSSGYLDDVAHFMQQNDFRPDYPNTKNVIDVYTVGFTTRDKTNDLLRKTAVNGNGLFFTGNQSDVLTEALVASVQDIISKSQGFSAATVPAARTSEGGYIYISVFQPSADRSFWPGYLRAYKITTSGEIRDSNGNCALENLADSGFCAGGTFKNETAAPPFWNAASAMPNPNDRKLKVSVLTDSGSQVLRNWNLNRNLAQLDLSSSFTTEFPLSPNVTATSDLDEAVVSYIAGCEWGTGMATGGSAPFGGCIPRTVVSGGSQIKDQLGDIFHSNPIVVGPPSSYVVEPSYYAFTQQPHVATRERVIYAGANDGFFHGFNAGTWNPNSQTHTDGTGVELFGFMPWSARTKVKDLAKDSSTLHPLTVDGSPSVSDVWLDSNEDPDDDKLGSEWRTYMISGMREGGEQYFALDITNPAASNYPRYEWEFPQEGDAIWRARIGQTWSKPIITRIRLGNVSGDVYEKWVAIVGFGYDATSDPNEIGPAGYDVDSVKGRGIMMIDVQTGSPIAVRRYGSDTGEVPDMHYAIPSTPGVLDYDQDGFADVIYIGDLGGNVWKWIVRATGIMNPTEAELHQADWPFRKFFETDPSNSTTARSRSFFFAPAATKVNGILHLGFGTGERANMNCNSTTDGCTLFNRYYILKDRDVWDSGSPDTIDGRFAPTGDLTDLTDFEDMCPSSVAPAGFFFSLAGDGEKFVTNSEVFNSFFFASTYKPDLSNACDPSGDSLLYGFLAKCGQGFFGPPSPLSPIAGEQRAFDIGKGVPTDARLSIAPGDGANRLIISKQDGELINIDSGASSSEHGVMYWREVD